MSIQSNYFNISENIFKRNSRNAIAVERSSEIVLQLSENQFIDIIGTAIVNLNTQGSSYKVVLELIKNQFINNIGTAIVNLNTQGSSYKVDLEMIKNQFINNTGTTIMKLDTQGSSSNVVLEMIKNLFIDNSGTFIVNLNTRGLSNVITISKNVWKNNSGRAMIRLNIPKYPINTSSFSDNELTQNEINKKYPLFPEYVVNEATILHINGNFQFKRNVFENPSARYEFATQSRFQGETIDVRLNWWGTEDPNIISSKIYDFASQNDLDIVDFLPFMSSKDMESKAIFKKSRNVFANGSKIGGPLINDVVLTKTKSPYLVIKDIIVYPNATLTIEPGVQVNVLPYLGFLVYGKMEIVGKENSLIRFDVGYLGKREIKQSVRPGYNPGYWRGIRFSDMAKSSEISYAKFERGGSYPSNGYNFVLQFDAQRQFVHDIEINDIGANGMNIIIPNQGFTFYNIIIGNGQYYYGIGIQSRTLALSLYNSSIIGTNKYARYGISFGRNMNTGVSDQRMSHVLAILAEITKSSILTKDICSYQGNETIIGEDSFVALSIGTTFGSGGVNCEHVLRIKSTATVSAYSAQSSYSGDKLTVSDRPHSLPNGTIYSMSSPFNDVFVFGPGVLYLRYFRRRGYSGVKTEIFILTSKSKLLFCLVNLKTISAFHLK